VSRCALFARLAAGGTRRTDIGAGGTGKTVLMRSWIAEAGLSAHAAWVAWRAKERDPQEFWISVADALRGPAAGSRWCGLTRHRVWTAGGGGAAAERTGPR